jgi:hypothetical protein
MGRFLVRSGLLLAALLMGWPNAASADFVHMVLHSEPGDFIGQGQDYDLTYTAPPDGISAQIRRRLPDGSPAELLFVLSGTGQLFSTVFFGTDALGIPIQPGYYPDAQRADFAAPGHPGLDVTLDGRGSNTLTGAFTIYDVTFSADLQQITSFSATFEQHSEGAAPALFGSFAFNAPDPAPEPSTLTLFALGTLGPLGYAWRRRRKPAAS